jgi:hypothetical protein
MLFPILRTRTDKPALCERGGGHRLSGYATLIADSKGGKKKSIFTINSKSYNQDHALVPLQIGDYIIEGTRENIQILSIYDFEELNAVCVPVATYKDEEWDNLPDHLNELVYAYFDKVLYHHCMEAIYVL